MQQSKYLLLILADTICMSYKIQFTSANDTNKHPDFDSFHVSTPSVSVESIGISHYISKSSNEQL